MSALNHPEAAQAIAGGALVAVSHSGGADSQAMLIRLLQTVPGNQLLVVHATLGESEWPGALELAAGQADDAGVPFVVTRAGKTFLEMAWHRFQTRPEVPSFPSDRFRQCTSDLKTGPIARAIRRYARDRGITRIVSAVGIRAEESTRRRRRPCWSCNARQSVAGRTWTEWNPVQDLTKTEVFETVRQAGQTPHFAYGLGSSRVSCTFCIYSRPTDLRLGAVQRPETYARYVDLERRTGYAMHVTQRDLVTLTGLTPQDAERLHKVDNSLKNK